MNFDYNLETCINCKREDSMQKNVSMDQLQSQNEQERSVIFFCKRWIIGDGL